MKWSFGIGRIFGIPIRIHITFLLLLVFVALNSHGGIMSGLMGVVFILLVFVGVLLHELGHSLVARHYGQKVQDIMLLPIGGVSRTEIPENPKQEMIMAAVGPFISLFIAAIFLGLSIWFGYKLDLTSFIKGTGSISGNLIPTLYYVNLMLGLFNLIPAFPMDGGRVLRGALALKWDPVQATRMAVGFGQLLAILMFFFGIFYDWWLALIAIFLYFGAEAEEQGTILHQALHRVPANAVMLEKFETLSPTDSLSHVIEMVCHTNQDDFPVLDGGRLVGILPKAVIFQAMREIPRDTAVSEMMITEFFKAAPTDLLDKVFDKLSSGGIGIVPVVEADKLLGIITLPQIAKYQMLCGARPPNRLSASHGYGR